MRLPVLLAAIAMLAACEPGETAAPTGESPCLACNCGNLVCDVDQTCTLQGGGVHACVDNPCFGVVCDRGMTCAPTGSCTCGGDRQGAICAAGELCTGDVCAIDRCADVVCSDGYACEPDHGSCKCGGVECAPGDVCEGGTCVTPSPCENRTCPTGTACNEDDGQCHCGGPTGSVCSGLKTCSTGGSCAFIPCSSHPCEPGNACEDDPERGPVCRCGGIGPEYPQCLPGQQCDLEGAFPRCLRGGDACFDSHLCDHVPGSSCDPEDGFCKCGGLDGILCDDEGLACVIQGDAVVCQPI